MQSSNPGTQQQDTHEANDDDGASFAEIDAETLAAQARAIAIEETTRQLIHELEPLLGAMRITGAREIVDYEDSKTRRLHERFDSLLQAISTLSKSSSSARPREFDLAGLIHELIVEQTSEGKMKIDEVGQSPLVVVGDPNLVSIAFRNGLCNSLEASSSVDSSAGNTILVTWGKTDRDVWIAILDRGSGLPTTFSQVFNIGSTTKPDHLGMGLPLAKSAIESMGGTIYLGPRQDGGAKFEFRWPTSFEITP